MNSSAWIEALGWMLIHFVWQGTLVAVCLWIACRAAYKTRPQVRYVTACLALLTAVAFAVGTLIYEVGNAFSAPQSSFGYTAAESPARVLTGPDSVDHLSGPVEATEVRQSAVPQQTKSEISTGASPRHATLRDRFAEALQPFTSTVVILWGLGVTLFSVRFWRSWRAVRHLRNSGERLEMPDLEKRFAALRAALRASRAAQCLVSARVHVPMVIGWLKPVIMLPASVLAGLSPAQLEAVLAHELAHICRHDYLVNLLQNAIETIFFYHPAVWWISRRIREEREHCCDDIAAAATGGALGYVDALAALEETRTATPNLVVAVNGTSLLDRARRLLLAKPAEGPAQGLFAGGLALLLMSATFVIPFTLSRAADSAASEDTTQRSAQVSSDAGTNEHFRAFDQVKRHGLWPAELMPHLPFGPAHPTGLRVAWIFRPMLSKYALGDALVSRIILHNTGKDPIEFLTESWPQDARWAVVDREGHAVTVRTQRFHRWKDSEQRMRLAPGEAIELPAPGLGIGPGDFDEVYGDDRVGVFLPARAGEEYRCKWMLPMKGVWVQSDDPDLATPKPANFETGEVKFRVYARDPGAPKPVSIATSDGRYILEPGLDLRILRMNFQANVVVNGVPREPMPMRESNWASIDPRPAVIPPGGKVTRKVSRVRLPDGDGSYVIAWQRGERTLWIGEADTVRKVDLTVAGKFPLEEILDAVDPLEREKLRELADNLGSGTSFPEKQWKWEDAASFAGMPAEIKAALEKHRPKAVKDSADIIQRKPGLDAAKALADAEALGVATLPAGGATQSFGDKTEPKPTQPDVVKQRQRVDRIKNEQTALEQLTADQWPEVVHLLGIEDETTRKIYNSLQTALAEEARLLASGHGENHPRIKAARAELGFHRKTLADQLESIKRARETKLQIEETQLKNMEAHFNAPVKQPEARYEQTRELLKFWQSEFERKPLFTIAINQKIQRKGSPSTPGRAPGSGDQSNRGVTFLDKSLSSEEEPPAQKTKAVRGMLPAEAMQRVAKHVRKFIEASPGPAAERFKSLLPRLEAEHQPHSQSSSMDYGGSQSSAL